MMKKRLILSLAAGLGMTLTALAGEWHWDFTQGWQGWGAPRNMSVTPGQEGLSCEVTARDASILLKNAELDPLKFNRFRIVYRAGDFKESTHGELFFAGKRTAKFVDANRFNIPSLVCDGEWHEMILVPENIVAGEDAWKKEGVITQLRLDIVNEFPGKITIKSVTALPPTLPPLTRLDEVTDASGILLPHRMLSKGTLKLQMEASPHWLWVRINPYDKEASAAARKIQTKPKLKRSGKTADNWLCLGKITPDGSGSIALTMPDPLPESVDSILLTPLEKVPRDRAKSIPDKVEVTLGKPMLKVLPAGFDALAPYFKGKMVMPQNNFRLPGKLWVRHKFSIPQTLKRALLQTAADDQIDAVRVNGKDVPGNWPKNWQFVGKAEIADFLKAGENTLEIEFTNLGGLGGILYEVDMLDADGKFTYIASGKESEGGIDKPAAKGSAVGEMAPAPYHPWLTVLDYTNLEPVRGKVEVKTNAAELNFDKPADVKIEFTVSGTPELTGDEVFFVRLVDDSGHRMAFKSGKLADWGKAGDNGKWSIAAENFTLPEYGPALHGYLESGFYQRENSNAKIKFTLNERPLPDFEGMVERSALVDAGQGPHLEVNGKPRFLIGMSVFHERGATGLEGADSPLDVRDFAAGGGEADWWVGDDEYDFSEVDVRINKIIKEYPNALIGVWVHCQPPLWYAKKYPERISLESNGRPVDMPFSTVTFSSREYQADAARAVTAMIQHCERYFGKKMFLYNLIGGVSYEWQGWGLLTVARRGVLSDYGVQGKRDFAAYAKERAPELGIDTVPGFEKRVGADLGFFRDPAKEAAEILYDEYYSVSVARCILTLAKAAKAAVGGKKLIGCYYGYAYEYCNKNYSVNSSGHNALALICDSPDIDIVISPPSYGVRTIGAMPGSDMKSFASLHSHGKLSVLEDDTRTHLADVKDFYQTLNAEQTQNVLRRNWGMALAQKTLVWHFPIETGHDFGSDAIKADLLKVKKAGEMIMAEDRQRNAEIAVVVDETSRKFVHPRARQFITPNRTAEYFSHSGKRIPRPRYADELLGELVYFQRITLNQCGAPTDYILLNDVPALAEKYKLFIFLDAFGDSPLLRESLAAVRNAGHNALIMYGAGFVGKDTRPDVTGMQLERVAAGPLTVEISDFRHPVTANAGENWFGTDHAMDTRFAVNDPDALVLGRYTDNGAAALAVKSWGDKGGKLWFLGSNMLTDGLLAAIAHDAGVHLYTAPGDTLFAGCGVITLHSKTSGSKTITLPAPDDVVDLYTGEVVAKNVTKFTYFQKAYTTRTFLIGKAGELKKKIGE